MKIFAECPSCKTSLGVSKELAGKRVRCTRCGHEFQLPGKTGAAGSGAGDPGSSWPGPRPDETLSRSMLPGVGPRSAPVDEMLCRLEPGTLRWLNITDAVRDFLGLTLDQLRHKSFLDSLHADDRALASDEFRQAAERGERHDFVLRILGRGGQLHYVRVYAQARYDHDGRINHIRCFLKDVTERVQAEQELRRRTEQLTAANEQLRQINKRLQETQSQLVHTEKLASLGTLAAGMAHEINNPLAFALNNVAVLERDLCSLLEIVTCYQQGWEDLQKVNPELAATIERRQAEIDLPYLQANLCRLTQATTRGLSRVAQIVQNLRGFAQLDRAERGDIDINESLDQCLEMIRGPLSQHHIAVQRTRAEVPPLEGAAAHLNQVFLNLLINALQAIEATDRRPGEIRISTGQADGQIVVEIADNGNGIPPDVLPRIFDPFFTTRPVGRGTGLGLSISHGIVADHGGRIEVDSTVGVGSRFRVLLPICRPTPDSNPRPTGDET